VVLIWIAFLVLIFVLLAIDLGVFHRRAHVVSVREALAWTVVWIATALAFAGFVYLGYEHHWLGWGLDPDAVDRSEDYPEGRVNDARSALVKFLTGYVVELSLSADNVVPDHLISSISEQLNGRCRRPQHRMTDGTALGVQ
jgi:tellurite resistance protein TerC